MRSPPVQVECSYPVPPIRLYEVLTDLDFLIARNERYGGVGTPTVEQTGDALVVTTVRRIPLEHAPAVAHRFLGDGQLVQVGRGRRPPVDLNELAVAEESVRHRRRVLERDSAHGCDHQGVAGLLDGRGADAAVPLVARNQKVEVGQHLVQPYRRDGVAALDLHWWAPHALALASVWLPGTVPKPINMQRALSQPYERFDRWVAALAPVADLDGTSDPVRR